MRDAELLTEALEGGGTDSLWNEPMDNSTLTLLPSLLFHALYREVVCHSFRIYCLPQEGLVGVALGEELWLHRRFAFPFPCSVSRGKVGLKAAKTYPQSYHFCF